MEGDKAEEEEEEVVVVEEDEDTKEVDEVSVGE